MQLVSGSTARRFVVRLVVGVTAVSFFSASSAPAADWQAGAASVKITPERLMWMSGYGSRNHPAEGTSK